MTALKSLPSILVVGHVLLARFRNLEPLIIHAAVESPRLRIENAAFKHRVDGPK